MRNKLSSIEWSLLFALRVERSNIKCQYLTNNEHTVVLAWLDRRIAELEAKK
jgi:hypothetical protein